MNLRNVMMCACLFAVTPDGAHGQQAACSTYSGGFTYCSDGTSVQSSDGFDYVTRPEPSVGADQSDSQESGE